MKVILNMTDIAAIAVMEPVIALDNGERYTLVSYSDHYVLTSISPVKTIRFNEGTICKYLYENGAKYSRDVINRILKYSPDNYF